MFISFVPADSGKATAKTNKANVRNGSCKWADPIYETTRLLQDSKTKQFEDKIYKIPVAMVRTCLFYFLNVDVVDNLLTFFDLFTLLLSGYITV